MDGKFLNRLRQLKVDRDDRFDESTVQRELSARYRKKEQKAEQEIEYQAVRASRGCPMLSRKVFRLDLQEEKQHVRLLTTHREVAVEEWKTQPYVYTDSPWTALCAKAKPEKKSPESCLCEFLDSPNGNYESRAPKDFAINVVDRVRSVDCLEIVVEWIFRQTSSKTQLVPHCVAILDELQRGKQLTDFDEFLRDRMAPWVLDCVKKASATQPAGTLRQSASLCNAVRLVRQISNPDPGIAFVLFEALITNLTQPGTFGKKVFREALCQLAPVAATISYEMEKIVIQLEAVDFKLAQLVDFEKTFRVFGWTAPFLVLEERKPAAAEPPKTTVLPKLDQVPLKRPKSRKVRAG